MIYKDWFIIRDGKQIKDDSFMEKLKEFNYSLYRIQERYNECKTDSPYFLPLIDVDVLNMDFYARLNKAEDLGLISRGPHSTIKINYEELEKAVA